MPWYTIFHMIDLNVIVTPIHNNNDNQTTTTKTATTTNDVTEEPNETSGHASFLVLVGSQL